MEPSRIFLKVRAVAFSCIGLTGLIWIILLSVEAFLRWDSSPTLERTMIILLLLVNTITVILLLVLILLPFRLWLDAARILFLLVLHLGLAAVFTYLNPRLGCQNQTADDEGVCKLVNIYILLASWVIPGFLLAYTSWLLFVVYRHWQSPVPAANTSTPITSDEEASISRKSTMPMIYPDMTSRVPTLWSEPSDRSSAGQELSSDAGRLSKQPPWIWAL